MERRQEINQFLSIAHKNIRNSFGFGWIGHEYLDEREEIVVDKSRPAQTEQIRAWKQARAQDLEHMKGFELDVFALLLQ